MLAYLRRGNSAARQLLPAGDGACRGGSRPERPASAARRIISGPIFRRNGTFVPEIDTGANANSYLNIGPPTEPFTPPAQANVVRTSVPTQYVRAYTDGVTSPIGSFLAGSNAIRGLNAEQIRDVLALPYLPDSLPIVQVPVGTCMIVGQAAPILGNFPANPPTFRLRAPGKRRCAARAADRHQLRARLRQSAIVPIENYINLQPIGDAALSYRPRAGGGNTLAVARALDAGPYPELYTDMDSIYNSLDLINIGDGTTLRSALTQLGGEPYADIPTVETQSARMFLDAVHDEVRLDRADTNTREVPVRQWLTGFGGAGGLDESGDLHGMDYQIAGVAGGIDRWFGPSFLAGFAVGLREATSTRTKSRGAAISIQSPAPSMRPMHRGDGMSTAPSDSVTATARSIAALSSPVSHGKQKASRRRMRSCPMSRPAIRSR